MCFARQNGFPANVVGFAPVDGRICARPNASGERSTPLRPAIRGGGTRADARLIGWRRWGGQTSEDEDQAQRTRHADTLCTFDVKPTQRLYFNFPDFAPVLLSHLPGAAGTKASTGGLGAVS